MHCHAVVLVQEHEWVYSLTMKSGSSFGTLKTEIPTPVIVSYKVEEKDSETDSPQPPGVNPGWAPVKIRKHSRAETLPAINSRTFIYNKRTEAQWQTARCGTLRREVLRRRCNEVYSGVGDQLFKFLADLLVSADYTGNYALVDGRGIKKAMWV